MPEFSPKEAAQAELAQRELCQRHLLPFIMRTNPSYKPGWVHKDICSRLERFVERIQYCVEHQLPGPRLMLCVPPRHGKSEIASRSLPAWFLGKYPRQEVIAASYAASLAQKFSRKARELARMPDFEHIFPDFAIDPDAQGVENWLTTSGGGYMAAGVSGPLTGNGMHLGIIDDPVKNREEAESETTQESVIDWYTSTFYTRLAPGAGILVIMTRWHDNDLAGWLLTQEENGEGDEWEKVFYPAVATDNEKYRKAGEALHQERYPLEILDKIKKTVGKRDWNALFQQNPVAAEGDYFTKGMIRYYRTVELPPKADMTYYTAWDLAVGTKQTNDWSVGITIGVDHLGRIFVVDVFRKRVDAYQLVEGILDQWELWNDDAVGIEKGVISMSIGPYLEKRIEERQLWGFPLEELKPGKQDKVARARSIQGRMRQGNVFFPEDAAWTQELINELLRFPSGIHDDQVDALAYIGLMLSMFHANEPTADSSTPKWVERLEGLLNQGRLKSSSHMSA